jgi:hypothetical protein
MNEIEEYIAPALGDLRHLVAGQPDNLDDRDDEGAELMLEKLANRAREYAQSLVLDHEDHLGNFYLALEHEIDAHGASAALGATPPSLVASEIRDTAAVIHELELYLKCLVIFGHRYAIEEFNQSELSRLSGATRVTIGRWLADQALSQQVAAIASRHAARAVAQHRISDSRDRASATMLGLLHWYASTPDQDDQNLDGDDHTDTRDA